MNDDGLRLSFSLDPRLKADTAPVAKLPLSDALLMEDARFPWLILVPRLPDKADLIDLSSSERAFLMEEIAAASRALREVTACEKLNVAALGNAVRQLHVHVIARFARDAAWPKPVWGAGEAVAYEAEARDRLIEAIRAALPA